MQGTGTVVKHVDLAAARRVEPAEFRTAGLDSKMCEPGFDGSTPRPPEYCYPFPVAVKIMAYKPGAGYTKASLTVCVTNSGRGPAVLPVGTAIALPRGEAGYLDLGVHLENVVEAVGFGSAYGDTGTPASLATVQPGESIEYEIPVAIEAIKAKLHPDRGTTVPVFVKLSYFKIKKGGDGGFTFLIDTNSIPSSTFRIPYPD
jgi:hypothetical protein